MIKPILYKGRRYRAVVTEWISDGRQHTTATIKIGRNEISLNWTREGWVKA